MQRISTPFGFRSTAAEVAGDTDLTGKRIIITGGAAGIGLEAARVLASAGAETTLAVRRPEASLSVAEELRHTTGNTAINVRPLDLADLRSVDSFVGDWAGPLHVLINNAGVMAVPERAGRRRVRPRRSCASLAGRPGNRHPGHRARRLPELCRPSG